jgi:hypothetical protein
VAELRAIAPYPKADGTLSIEQMTVQRKWSVRYGGLTYGRAAFDYYERAAALSPDYSPDDLAAVDKGSALSLPRLWPHMMKADFTSLTELRCSVDHPEWPARRNHLRRAHRPLVRKGARASQETRMVRKLGSHDPHRGAGARARAPGQRRAAAVSAGEKGQLICA